MHRSPSGTRDAAERLRQLQVVTDSGEGIDPQFVPHLFDRFRRSDESLHKGSGSGLGLSIARAYARAHGDDLLYHAPDEGGAEFELVLPRTTP